MEPSASEEHPSFRATQSCHSHGAAHLASPRLTSGTEGRATHTSSSMLTARRKHYGMGVREAKR